MAEEKLLRGKRLFCRSSGQCAGQRNKLPWLTTPCRPPAAEDLLAPGLISVRPEQAVVAGQQVHSSHAPAFHEEQRLWVCTTCGYFARDQLRKLGEPCTGYLSQAGRDNLSRLRKGAVVHPRKAPRAV